MDKFLSECIDLIYDSVSDPRGWEAFSRHVMKVIDADYCHTLITDFEGPSHNYGVERLEETGQVKAYQKQIYDEGALKQILDKQADACAFTSHEFFHEISAELGDPYAIFLPGELTQNFLASFIRTEQNPAYSIFHMYGRSSEKELFEKKHYDFLAELVKHTKRAYALSISISHTAELNTFIVKCLNHIPAGVFIVSYRGGVLAMNDIAKEYLATEDFEIVERRLVCRDARVNKSLQESLERITAQETSEGECLQYEIKEGKKYFISCSPHSKKQGDVTREWRLSDGAQCIVFITDETRIIELPKDRMKVLFGFTAAEVNVAEQLVNGKSTSEIAQILNVNINTVRYHLKSCYVKAQVNNQAELVGLVLRVMVSFTTS